MSAPAPLSADEVPRFVQYVSPVSTGHRDEKKTATTLPLNIIALINEYIDDVADLARVTRTCRLLYYMTLPQLYQRVSLRSYPEIRYVNGRPEGFGSGSPFTMALNGLVTKSHGSLVEEFRIWGTWNEVGQEDFAKGRVPDNSMMLNILLRAATDKMVKLRTFSWELECKPLKTLYQGLATHNTLTRLSMKFPNSRVPRPSVMIPPMANLRVFKATDIDPLCYPDDISMLMLHSKRLEDVRLHFSPRMRRVAEPTLSLATYFGRCQKAGYRMRVKHFALQNFFGANMEGMDMVWDSDTCVSMTFFDTFGGLGSPSRTVYIDETWKNIPQDMPLAFTHTRCNEVAVQHVDLITKNKRGIERMYFVNAKHPHSRESESPITPGDTPPSDVEMLQLGKDYIYALTRHHGKSLKHLLLREEWALTQDQVSDIVRYCPNLEQLGLALNTSNHDILRLLMPFLPQLRVVRLLMNEWLAENLRSTTHEERMAAMSQDLVRMGAEHLQYIDMGGTIYKVGKLYEDGKVVMSREVTMASKEDVQHLEIFSLDCLDIDADPIAPFSP